MGAYLSEPMTGKESEDGEGNKLKFGACSMQGWRVSQEDAHNCIASFDEKSSLFSVYDGHGGAEVAIYLSRHLPEVLKTCANYKNGEFIKALEECFLTIDGSIKTPEVIKEIQELAKRGNSEREAQVDYEEENVGALYEEATMPLDKLVAKYQTGSNEEGNAEADGDADCKPGSSKSMSSSSSGCPGPSSSSSKSICESTASSSGSSSASCVSSSEAGSNVNGKPKESIADGPGPADSSSSPDPTKTDADGNKADADSSCELVVHGTKIDLKKDKPSSVEGEVDSSSHEISEKIAKPTNGMNGTSSEDNEVKSEQSPSNGEAQEGESSEPKPSASAVNGDSGEVSSSSAQENCATSNATGSGDAVESKPETPRRKKVHPTPVPMEDLKPERRSPRKNQRAAGFELLDSDESDDEDDAGYDEDEGDSDSENDGGEEESSNEEDDDEDDYEDEEEEEDERFLNDIQEPGYDSGSTAVVCFAKWEEDGLSMYVANAGDSRCVVCREGKAVDMSHDHKPELDEEAQRIVKAGGKVTEDGRVNGGLNLSRALGDHSYKQNPDLPPEEQMISPLPSIQHIVLEPKKDKFFVLACDGIWNSMSSQEVVDFVSKRLSEDKPLSKICEELFDFCLAPDTCGDGTGCDNMTAIIVKLPEPESAEVEVSTSKKRRLSESEEGNITSESKKTKTEEGVES